MPIACMLSKQRECLPPFTPLFRPTVSNSADFRSDTLTQPTAAMKAAMMEAPLGDDVFGEDPTIIALEHSVARRFGREAAVFCPSGTMCNQLAIVCHTRPGEELIADRLHHVYQYEAAGYAFHAGLGINLIDGDRGRPTAEEVEAVIQPDDPHKPPSRLVVLENSCNKGGGSIYPLSEARRMQGLCTERGLKLHLDGARLFNALVAEAEQEMAASGEAQAEPEEALLAHVEAAALAWGAAVDSISLCLSKGLGCPVGSVLIGDQAFIAAARRMRKRFGGGMRQAGMLAAAGLFALEHHVARMREDHARARRLGAALAERPWVKALRPVDTNIAIAELTDDRPMEAILAALSSGGVEAIDMSPTLLRFVTHLDVDDTAVDRAIACLQRIP
jgi:threonine aldolase